MLEVIYRDTKWLNSPLEVFDYGWLWECCQPVDYVIAFTIDEDEFEGDIYKERIRTHVGNNYDNGSMHKVHFMFLREYYKEKKGNWDLTAENIENMFKWPQMGSYSKAKVIWSVGPNYKKDEVIEKLKPEPNPISFTYSTHDNNWLKQNTSYTWVTTDAVDRAFMEADAWSLARAWTYSYIAETRTDEDGVEIFAGYS